MNNNPDYIDDSFHRFFTFWFAEIANGEKTIRSVPIRYKDYYIRTKEATIKHGPIIEDSNLKNKVEQIFAQLS